MDPSMHRKATFAAVIGNAIEWFDFAVYGLLSGVISRLYFPAIDPATSVLIGFTTLGIPFVARPLGGLIFGIWADRHGRRNVLSLAFGMMSFGTLMIGVLPTYAAIGIAAPLLLVLSRMIQGLSAGGEFGSATTALVEFAPMERRGFYGSLQFVSQSLAILMGSLTVVALSKSLDPASFEGWGWRLPFIAGALIGPIGLYMRMKVTETPEFIAARDSFPDRPATPLKTILKSYKIEILAFIGIFAALTGPTYVNLIYLPTIAVHQLGISYADATMTVTVLAVLLVLFIPVAGWMSDLFDQFSLMSCGLLMGGISYAVIYAMLLANPSQIGLILLYVSFAFPYALVTGAASAFVIERLPVRARATGTSLSYNMAVMIFGGMAPLTVSWLAAEVTQYAASLYVAGSMALGFVGVLLLEFKRRGLRASS